MEEVCEDEEEMKIKESWRNRRGRSRIKLRSIR
jgi:hypothetical protein